MRIPDPKANTTTEAYLAYKAGYLEESELKPKLYEPYLHFDGWLAYWAGLVPTYPIKAPGKNLFNKNTVSIGSNWSGGLYSICWPFTGVQVSRAVCLSPVKPNTTYTISLASSDWYLMEIIDVDNEFVIRNKFSTTSRNEFSQTITTHSYTKFLGFKFKYGSAGTTTITEEMLPELKLQVELGNSATEYEDYGGEPDMITDEEALVAYLSGVTDTYPEDIRDPEDVRITGYLRHLVSARWPEPDYPVNNQEFYLSTMKPPVVTNETPSANIELTGTAQAPFIDVKAYGDTSQDSLTGKNLMPLAVVDIDATHRSYSWLSAANFSAGNYMISFDLESFDLGENTEIGITFRIGTTDKNFMINSSTTLGRKQLSFEFSEGTPVNTGQVRIGQTLWDKGARADIANVQIEAGEVATDYEVYTGGESSPSLSYGQPVRTVTGRQDVIVNGKNLYIHEPWAYGSFYTPTIGAVITGDTSTESRVSTTVGKNRTIVSSVAQWRGAGFISEPLTAGNYYFTGRASTLEGYNMRLRITYLDENYAVVRLGKYWNSDVLDISISEAITINEGEKYVFFGVCSSSAEGNPEITLEYMQLEAGTEPTEYEPDAEVEINLGKNMFEPTAQGDSHGIVYTNNGDGSYTISGTGDGSVSSRNLGNFQSMRIYKGQVYTVSTNNTEVNGNIAVRLVDRNGYVVSGSQVDCTNIHASKVFVSNVDAWVTIQGRVAVGTDTVNNFIIKPQFECGTHYSGFSEYFEPIELCKINGHQDYIYRNEDGDWYLHKEVKKLKLTGSSDETWSVSNSGTENWFYRYRDVSDYKQTGSFANPNSICDSLPKTTISSSDTNKGYCILESGDNKDLRIRWGDELSTTDWRNYLNTKPILVYYVTDTPTDTQITNPEIIRELNELIEDGSDEGLTDIRVIAEGENIPALLKVEAGAYR